MQHTEASATVFQHEDKARHRSDTTGSAESRPGPEDSGPSSAQRVEDEGRLEQEQEQEDEIQVGEEAPGHTVRDVELHKGTKLRRGSVKKGMKWAFWYNGNE